MDKKINKKKVLLVVLPYIIKREEGVSSKLRSFVAFPYGVLSIASFLKRNNINVKVLDLNLHLGNTQSILDEILNEFNPDFVGLSMMFDNSYRIVEEITIKIKNWKKKILILLGGSAATSSYSTILEEQENIDAICYYEGELPFLNLINCENVEDCFEKSPAWITRKTLMNGKEPQKELIQDLDDVINIDYSLIDVDKYGMKEGFSPFASKRENRKQFFLVTSRGCPFNCTFCMHSSDKDKSMRYASIDEILKHLKFLISEYKMNVLTIYDDQLLLNKKRAKRLFRELSKFDLRIECPNGLSVAFIDDELVKYMKEAGMDTICLAIESGSPYVLNKIMHKPLNLKKVKSVVEILRKYNFWIQGFFVTGMPGETDEHREETVRFIKEVGLDWSGFSLAVPSRGSLLHKICIENNYIKKNMKIDELDPNKYIIKTPEYSPDYVTKKTYLMNLDVNFVNNYRMKQEDYGIARDAFADVIRRYPNHAFALYFLFLISKRMKNHQKAEEYSKSLKNLLELEKLWLEYFNYFKINI